jgi:hypothetical protein
MHVNFGSFMANAWARSFLAHCKAEMKRVVPDGKSRALRINADAAALFRKREPSLPDRQTKALVASCCLVLAAYRDLRGDLGEPEAYGLVRDAVYRVYRKPMRFLVRLWLWLTRNPLNWLRGDRWRNQSRRMYGAGMQFDQEETEESVDLLVRRCTFHDFFLEHGEAELTRVFCAWDRNWMDVLDEAGRSIRTERPETISTGGACCRFRVARTDNHVPKGHSDIILLELSRLRSRNATKPVETATSPVAAADGGRVPALDSSTSR